MNPLDDMRRRLDALRRELDELARREVGGEVLLTGDQTVTGVKTFSNGIKFANETLSVYDTGTWSPTITASTPGTLSTGYTIRNGRYTRIGDVVYFSFFLRLSGYAPGTASGETHITGLPYTPGSSNLNIEAFVAVSNGVTWPGTPASQACEVVAGNDILRLFAGQASGARQYVGPAAVSAAADISGTGFYFV